MKDKYIDMNLVHSERECERYKIMYNVFEFNLLGFRDIYSHEYEGQKDGDVITILYDKEEREIVMSDSCMERKTNIDFINRANGDVLIGGLGLGMIILAIQNKPEVKTITVVEIDKKLVDFIMVELKDKLNDKVNIVISDINKFDIDNKYDVVYCDIWNHISEDNWDEMKSLTHKFKNRINKTNDKSFIDHWRKKDVQKLYYSSLR